MNFTQYFLLHINFEELLIKMNEHNLIWRQKVVRKAAIAAFTN